MKQIKVVLYQNMIIDGMQYHVEFLNFRREGITSHLPSGVIVVMSRLSRSSRHQNSLV